MNNQHIPDGLLDKLNKLKALEEGAKSVGSHEEAANAADKYYTLLMKYNLTEEAVTAHGVEKKIQMLCSEFNLKDFFAHKASDWVASLIRNVSYYCLCRCVRTDEYQLSILGEKQNVATVFYIVEQLVSKIHVAFKQAWKDYTGRDNQKTFRRGFLTGAVVSITEKLRKQEESLQTETGMGLMVISKRDLATRFKEQKFPNTVSKTSQSGRNVSRGAYEAGREAGRNININKGLTRAASGSKTLSNGE